MLYHEDGRQRIVADPEAHQAGLSEGFSAIPQPRHQRTPLRSQHDLGIQDPLQDTITKAIRKVLDERGLTAAWVQAMGHGMSVAPGAQAAYTTGELPPVPLTPRRSDNGK